MAAENLTVPGEDCIAPEKTFADDPGSPMGVVMHSQFFQFFGLRENAFSMNPDPSYLFVNRRTQAVLDELANALLARKTLLLLTGEVGTGKTTLINSLMDWLNQQRIPTAFIFN